MGIATNPTRNPTPPAPANPPPSPNPNSPPSPPNILVRTCAIVPPYQAKGIFIGNEEIPFCSEEKWDEFYSRKRMNTDHLQSITLAMERDLPPNPEDYYCGPVSRSQKLSFQVGETVHTNSDQYDRMPEYRKNDLIHHGTIQRFDVKLVKGPYYGQTCTEVSIVVRPPMRETPLQILDAISIWWGPHGDEEKNSKSKTLMYPYLMIHPDLMIHPEEEVRRNSFGVLGTVQSFNKFLGGGLEAWMGFPPSHGNEWRIHLQAETHQPRESENLWDYLLGISASYQWYLAKESGWRPFLSLLELGLQYSLKDEGFAFTAAPLGVGLQIPLRDSISLEAAVKARMNFDGEVYWRGVTSVGITSKF